LSIGLNVQVQTPDLLILDEPLAGLGMKMNLALFNSTSFCVFPFAVSMQVEKIYFPTIRH
jgi:hypothetical protein